MTRVLLQTLLWCSAITLLANEDMNQIIDRHIKARGGAEAWQATKSMRVTGTFTAFSLPKPFELAIQRPGLLYFDHHLGEWRNILGFDGQRYWWLTPLLGEDSTTWLPSEGHGVARQMAEFGTPFIDYKSRGIKVTYQGIGEIEGMSGHMFHLVQKDGWEETWYLDPETGLEIARKSKGFDVGEQVDQITWYSDFRKVGDLVMPFLIESEFRTRHRVMEIAEVELNSQIDPKLFHKPTPTHIKPLHFLSGDWNVSIRYRKSKDDPWQDHKTQSVWRSDGDGNLMTEMIEVPAKLGFAPLRRHLVWNKHHKNYQATEFHGMTNHIKLMQGQLKDKTLTLDNLLSDTEWTYYGETYHDRIEFKFIDHNHFRIDAFYTTDKGESWFANMELRYQRIRKKSEEPQ